MSTKAAIYVKETAGDLHQEHTGEIQTRECEGYCEAHGLDITARYYDGPGSRVDFDRMMEEATSDAPPFGVIVVRRRQNFSWSLDETVLCRDRLDASGVSLLSVSGF